MTIQPSDPNRRYFLRAIGMSTPLLLAGGGLGACTTSIGDHAVDAPHLGHSAHEDAWRALETASIEPGGFAGGFSSALEAMAEKELSLDGFVRRTPNFGRYLLTRRAVGCSVCQRQRLWPAVDLVFQDPDYAPPSGPVTVCGAVDLRRQGDRMPVGLRRAFVIEA